MSPPPHRLYVGKDTHKFSAAHMTVFPDGSKERLHGHNFRVTCALDLLDVSFAAFLDFGVLKQALEEQCRAWNERLILADRCPFWRIVSRDADELEFVMCDRRYVVPADEVVLLPVENIVVETLAVEFARGLAERLGPALRPEVVSALTVDVTESDGQGASYRLGIGPR